MSEATARAREATIGANAISNAHEDPDKRHSSPSGEAVVTLKHTIDAIQVESAQLVWQSLGERTCDGERGSMVQRQAW